MNPLNLAGIDQPLTPVILGTMTFGDTVAEPAAAQMIDHFLAAGGIVIDTANGYADGHSESMLARLLRDHRDQVVLATKVGIPHPDADDAPPLSIEGIRRCVAGSLHRLDTDHVDLLYLHQPDRATPIGQTLTALQELLDNGDIRAWGVSNFAAWQIAELRYTAADLGIPDPVIAQQIYNVVATRLDDEYAEYAAVTSLPTVIYNPLAGGLLTGKYSPSEQPPTGRFGPTELGTTYRNRYWNDTVFTALDALQTLANDAGMPPAELALRWAINRPVVDAVLVGGSRPENIRSNLAAIGKGPLPTELTDAVTAISASVRGPMPPYNR